MGKEKREDWVVEQQQRPSLGGLEAETPSDIQELEHVLSNFYAFSA